MFFLLVFTASVISVRSDFPSRESAITPWSPFATHFTRFYWDFLAFVRVPPQKVAQWTSSSALSSGQIIGIPDYYAWRVPAFSVAYRRSIDIQRMLQLVMMFVLLEDMGDGQALCLQSA